MELKLIDIKEAKFDRDVKLANDNINSSSSVFLSYLDFFSSALNEIEAFNLLDFYKHKSKDSNFKHDDLYTSQILRICNEKILQTYRFFQTETEFFKKEMDHKFYTGVFAKFEKICLDNLQLMKKINNFVYIILRESQNYEDYFTLEQLKKENDMNYVEFDLNPDESTYQQKWKNLFSLKENINKFKGMDY